MVDDGERLVGRAHLAAGQRQSLEGLRRRHLVHEMAVDIKHARPVRLLVDDVIVEDLVIERLRSGRAGHGVGFSLQADAILPEAGRPL